MNRPLPPRPARRFVPDAFDRLEDRLALSHAGAAGAAHVRAAATTPTAAATDLPAQLAAASAQINQAYATFAETVRSAELNAFAITTTSYSIPTAAGPRLVSSSSSVTFNAQTLPAISAAVDTLAGSIAAALGSVPSAARGAGLIAAGINGPGLGSLGNQLTTLMARASAVSQQRVGPIFVVAPPPDGATATTTSTPATGTVGLLPLAQLYSAFEGAMAASYNATAVQVYLAAQPPAAAGGTVDLATPINAAYGALATVVQQASLPPVFSPDINAAAVAPAGQVTIPELPTFASIEAQFAANVQFLADKLGSTLAGPPAPALALIQAQVNDASPGSLRSQVTQAIAQASAASPLYTYDFFDQVLGLALQASYNATAIAAVLASPA